MTRSTKQIISITFNFVIVCSTLLISIMGVQHGAGLGQVGNDMVGWGYFKPFTIDSNILMAFAALFMMIFQMREYYDNKLQPSRWLKRFYLMGTVSLALTLLTVVFFLAPSFIAAGQDVSLLFSGDMLFFHLLNPVLAIISTIFLIKGKRFRLRDRFWAILPCFVYSIVYLVHVVFVGDWEDFYGFTFGRQDYLIPFTMMGMYLVTAVIAGVVTWLHNKRIAKN